MQNYKQDYDHGASSIKVASASRVVSEPSTLSRTLVLSSHTPACKPGEQEFQHHKPSIDGGMWRFIVYRGLAARAAVCGVMILWIIVISRRREGWDTGRSPTRGTRGRMW